MSAVKRSLLPLLALGVLALLVWRSAFLIDDAYISFRYARNWADLGVPTYHPLDQPPVEGYSNFLWVLLLRLAYGVGLPLEPTSQVLGILFGAATLLLLQRFLTGALELPSLPSALATLSLAAFPPFAVWCTGGLETSLLGLLCLWSYAATVRRSGPSSEATSGADLRAGLWGGLLALALALTRVEGLGWALVSALAAAITLDPGHRRRRLLAYCLPLGTGFAVFLLWRHAVYGEWLANTVYAKAGLTVNRLLHGAKTTASFFLLFPSALAAFVLGALALSRGGQQREIRQRRAAFALALGWSAFVAYDWLVGGDWMPFFRFLAPGAPWMAALLALGLARLRPVAATTTALALAAISLLPLFDLHPVPRSLREALEFREFKQIGFQSEWGRLQRSVQNLEKVFLPLGRALRQVATPEDSLTFGAIGAVGWESNMRLLDYNGLVDREVAHRKGTTTGRSAGHDKAVPRAWFLPRHPTMFHALLVATGETRDTPAVRAAVRRQGAARIEERVFSNPEEEPLRALTQIDIHPLRPEPGIAPGTWLVILHAR